MPTYDYTCECGYEFERRAGYEDRTLPCPRCGSEAERVPVYRNQSIIGETVSIPMADGRKLGFTKKAWDKADALSAKARKAGVSR